MKKPKSKPEPTNKELEDAKNQLARALADYQNLVKRFEKERLEVVLRANQNLLRNLFPIVDSLETVHSFSKDQGLQMVIDDLYKLFEENGIEVISPEAGDKYDETKHEAVDSVQGTNPGTIAQSYSKGYKWKQNSLVLTPARVQVYK